ncbi:ubiquitin-protein ligase TUL1 [Kluyveromyces lactis]|uniref:RING-type E3 ubiquitin transferase n=1 Tax=Kluyveromyces lactis (strain ATCC 8585 / CBS 2359 / DSM 70799 / NBRC 1267 / NRRL Y-1140 / WM37) TaxID=284590 RepID=Q6CIL6_KLULA|nr:uncharacterized protein KLLA0_F25674g [Kluyveromyces lactis]CAG98931.1 KLLA0F25674p [Kluyveromyces lactis]|eukprot:XP_456223.1 uncharacterized protein KLLA0_F25674g [Kluyveromyces lactis]
MSTDNSRIIFFIIILLFFLSSPSGDGVTSQYEFIQLETLKSQLKYEYEVFRELSYDQNFRNITGLKLAYHDSKENPNLNATYPLPHKDYSSWKPNENYMMLPQDIIDKVQDNIWNRKQTLFPPNITSNLYGKINLTDNNKYTKIKMPIANFFDPPESFQDEKPADGEHYLAVDERGDAGNHGELHNVSWSYGIVDVSIQHLDSVENSLSLSPASISTGESQLGEDDSHWKILHLNVNFYNREETEKHSLSTKGIYDIWTGRILIMSQSAKFHSLFAFPHYLANTEKEFNQVKRLIEKYWNATNYAESLTMANLQHLSDEANTKCEYFGFLQLEPWDQFTPDQIRMIDEELKWPLGRPINRSNLPPIRLHNALLYSPDCGLSLELEDVHGPRYELQVRTIRIHLLLGVLLFLGQIYLLLCQMNFTNTPSSVNKISYWCLFMMNLVDGCLAMLYFLASPLLQELYLPLCISAFACFILASVFEIRYMISVYASQVNEQGVGILTLLRGGSEANTVVNRVIPDEASISSSLYGRFFFTLIVSIFILLSSLIWPKEIRTIFEYSVLVVLNSYWVPQICRNAVKGSDPRRRRQNGYQSLQNGDTNCIPLLWSFIIGTSVLRLIPIVYVFTYPSNVFRHDIDVRFAVLLSLWMLFQLLILYSQDLLGSRWFLPQHVIPDGYHYHRPVPQSILMEYGSQNNCFVCPICMVDVPVYVEETEETHKIDAQSYMITPCSHIFHTECLENWMSYKLQCPVCRAPLPPL